MISTAITRQTRSGQIIGIKEAAGRLNAIRAVTVEAAWQLGMEDKLGTLDQGKYADLVILSQNPMQINPDQIRDIEVLGTWVAGVQIYKKAGSSKEAD